MNVKIIQRQDKELLEEHAKSSFNFGLLGRNKLYVAIAFFLIGITISLVLEDNRSVGIPFAIIGLIEIIKYPGREKRWVKGKEKDKFFNRDLEFEISEDYLKISFDKESKTHHFESMRQCLISETGILFKISWSEYCYISFKSLENDSMNLNLINHLKNQFREGKIKEKRS